MSLKKDITKVTLVIGILGVLIAVISLIAAAANQSILQLFAAAVWLAFGITNIHRYTNRSR